MEGRDGERKKLVEKIAYNDLVPGREKGVRGGVGGVKCTSAPASIK
jgi:hypothetical protein